MPSRYQSGNVTFNDYLVLNPEKGSLFDLVRLLVSKDWVTKKDFLDRPQDSAAADEHLNHLRYRLLVFLSIVVQKIFLLLKKPVAVFGACLEFFINLVSANGGLNMLFFNIIRGKVTSPKDKWDGRRSVLGYADARDDLDETIKEEDNDDERYVVHLSLMASKLAYEESAIVQHVVSKIWEMKFLHFYNFWDAFQGKFSTQAFVFQTSATDPDLVVVSFRGTEPFNMVDWCSDVDLSWCGIEGVGKLHGGFIKALGLPKNMEWPKESGPSENNGLQGASENNGLSAYYTLRQILRDKSHRNENTKFIITGHSLGAALAILFVGMLTIHDEAEVLRRIRGVYTFGQPRVGDGEFAKYMMEKLKTHNVVYRRFVYCNDVVPRVPFDDKLFFFKHFGACMFYDSLYKGSVLKEEPNENYLSLVWALPMYLNAYWELIRGRFLPVVKGRLYEEGFVLVLFRLIGLVVPGVSAHGPQDYDNVTRLGNTRLLPAGSNLLLNGNKFD